MNPHRIVAALRAVLPDHCVLHRAEDTRPYECDGLTLYRQLPMVVVLPEEERQVAQVLQTLPRARGAGGGARGRHRAVGQRAAARERRAAVDGQVQSHPQYRSALPHRHGRAGRAQSGDLGGSLGASALLRARSVEPDCLHHRWQCRGKLRRRALSQVRTDGAQCAARPRTDHQRRSGGIRRHRARFTGTRPARDCHRFRGHAGRDHRSHRPAGAAAASGPLHHGEFCAGDRCLPRGGSIDRRGHHSGRTRDARPGRLASGRAVRTRRLRPRCGRRAAVRIRWDSRRKWQPRSSR